MDQNNDSDQESKNETEQTDINQVSTDILTQDKPVIYLLIGPPESGKSHALNALIYEHLKPKAVRKYSFGRVYSGSDKLNKEFEWAKPFVKSIYTEEDFEQYLSGLEKIAQSSKKTYKKDDHATTTIPPNFVIFNDMLGKVDLRSGVISNFISLFRQYNCDAYFTAQQLIDKGSSTLMRECQTGCLMWRSNFQGAVENLYRLAGTKLSQDEFEDLFYTATEEKYSSLLFMNNRQGAVEDMYYYHMAPAHVPSFKLKVNKKESKAIMPKGSSRSNKPAQKRKATESNDQSQPQSTTDPKPDTTQHISKRVRLADLLKQE